jgi:phosphohistidine phosphatase SixA
MISHAATMRSVSYGRIYSAPARPGKLPRTMRVVPSVLASLCAAACGGNPKTAADAADEPADVARELPASPTVVYVVRHAEAAAPTGDPSLSAEGVARAERLATVLADKRITAVDATQFKRTQETGQLVADAAGIVVEVQPVDTTNIPAYAPVIAAHVRQQHAGTAVLIVGHSNTVPATVEALSGTAVPPIAATEYDRLYTITIAPDGSAELASGTY